MLDQQIEEAYAQVSQLDEEINDLQSCLLYTSVRKRDVPYLRRTMGILFQDFRLIDKMTVYDNVAFAMHIVGASDREIRKRVPYVRRRYGTVSYTHLC